MANKDDYLTYYREFFENFAQTVNPNDQLPVRLAGYKLLGTEVVGGIIDWTTQYLSQKKCPPHLFAPLIKIVIEEMRKACKKHPPICGFNPDDNAYEPLKLMQSVMAKTNEVCLRYLDNSMLCSLPSPNDSPVFYPTSTCAFKNCKRKMEDRHVVIHDLNTMLNIQEASPSSYYAVFDGHAGVDAAAYSAAHLHQFLAESHLFTNNPKQALYEAFCKTDAHFTDKCKVEHLSSGTTAVVALLRPKEKTLYVAWTGDSQALLASQGKLMQLVNPHKPNRPDEKDRIERNGGCVLLFGTWRVNGQLAVSRAIGDVDYKPHVTAVPDVIEVPLDGNEDFLVLACDGLWDFVSEELAAKTIYKLVRENPDDTDRISQHLVQAAREGGSTDNISVIVVLLRDASLIATTASNISIQAAVTVSQPQLLDATAMETTMVEQQGLVDSQANEVQMFNGTEKQKEEHMFGFGDNYAQNGTDISPTKDMDFYEKEKSNGKRQFDDSDDDFGPETDVDAVDDSQASPFTMDLAAKGCDSKMFEGGFPQEDHNRMFVGDFQHPENKIFEGEYQSQENKIFEGEYQSQDRKLFEEGFPPQENKVFEESFQHQDNRMLGGDETQDNRMFGGGDGLGEYNEIFGGKGHPEMFEGGDKILGEEGEDNDMIKGDEGVCNPFMEHMEKAEKEDGGMKENKNEDEDQQKMAREETPTPPVDAVHDVSGLVDNVAESDSEDEWDYIKGEEANQENKPPRTHKEIDEIPEGEGCEEERASPTIIAAETAAACEAEAMSQLNPNAAEFVPVSPPATSPVSRAARLMEDDIIAQSPKRPMNMDRVIDLQQFENEIKSRPSELDDSFCSNGHEENGHNLSSNLLNGKNIDEIPEFQPGSTPTKSKPDEFHFGPNAAPFTPKHHDQSEAMSTKAIFGDDSAQNIETSFTSTEATSPAKSPLKKESDDPMSMSFYANRNDHNPFDLNKVQMLPDNLDEFLHQSDNSAENETSEQKSGDLVMNNDDALQTTDLDKHSYDDEKELASPLEPEKELSCPDFRDDGVTPEPTNENLLCGDFCQLSEKSKTPEPLPRDVELISPDSAHESPQSRPESIPPDVELLSPQPQEQIPQSATEVADLLGGFDTEQQQDLLCERPQSNSPMCEKPMSESPMCERPMSESPMCERPMSESPLCDKLETQSSVCERPESKSPVCERLTSPDFEERETKEEEMKQVEIEPEEPQKEKEEEDVQATIVIGAQDVIEIEEEPSEYIPSPAAEPVDMEPQVIEPVQDLCPLEKPSVNTEVFELGDVQGNKETDLDKPVGEVEVRMENISPQFAEQAFVMTPSEESKQEDVPTAPLVEATVPELLAAPAAVPPLTSAPAEPTAAETAAVAAAGVAAAATVAVAAAAVAAKPAAEDKKRTPVAAKKVPATKTASPSPRVGAKPAAGAAAKAKTTPVAAKTSPAKTATTAKSSVSPAASKPAAASRMPASKPKTIPVPKPAERKPSTNGDVKQPPIRATLAAKKPASETTATKTTTRPSMTARPATAAPRTTASAPKPAPRPTTAPKVAAPRTNGTTTSAASRLKLTTPKKSPVTSKTASTATKTGASLPLKTTSSAPAKPAFTTSTKPKPASTAAPAAPKPRVPLSRRPATETDKQSKEAVNKATAGRTTATRTGVTALRKVETKTATTTRTTVMKSTTTTMKSNATKKPAEIVRNKSAKTTTQKTEISEKPEMNGITDKAPESLQVVPQTQNEVFNTDSESQLVKDNSPSIDNKTIENTLIQTNTAD